jgi:hypothetical protein
MQYAQTWLQDLEKECAAYEEKIKAEGGIELFLGGVSRPLARNYVSFFVPSVLHPMTISVWTNMRRHGQRRGFLCILFSTHADSSTGFM